MRRRVLTMALSTVFGLRKRGFFIPYRYADQIPPRLERPPYAALEAVFTDAAPRFAALLKSMDSYAQRLHAIGAAQPPEPRWNQDWFPRLDAAALYVLVREARPGRIVEVGSGHSTRFIGRAIRDGGLASALTAIDPAPRAGIEGTGAALIRTTVQAADPAVFADLSGGDILSIDSSHILMPGTDVDYLLNRILPALKRGVLVQVHDIFLPDDYPPAWEWRGYNEQLAIATLIQGGAFRVLWSSHYVTTRMPAAVNASTAHGLELKDGAREASLWLEKI